MFCCCPGTPSPQPEVVLRSEPRAIRPIQPLAHKSRVAKQSSMDSAMLKSKLPRTTVGKGRFQQQSDSDLRQQLRQLQKRLRAAEQDRQRLSQLVGERVGLIEEQYQRLRANFTRKEQQLRLILEAVEGECAWNRSKLQ